MDIYLEYEYYPEDKEYSFVNPLINNIKNPKEIIEDKLYSMKEELKIIEGEIPKNKSSILKLKRKIKALEAKKNK